jgi:hypothetical protein
MSHQKLIMMMTTVKRGAKKRATHSLHGWERESFVLGRVLQRDTTQLCNFFHPELSHDEES